MQRPHKKAHRILWLIMTPLILGSLMYAATHRPVWSNAVPSDKTEIPDGKPVTPSEIKDQ